MAALLTAWSLARPGTVLAGEPRWPEPIAKIDSVSTDNLPGDIARSISKCWHAPEEGDEITLRISFRRDGSVFGAPRITYMRASGGEDGRPDLANSILAAIAACSPLRFTPRLGAAIAGRVFLIRFVALRKERRAAVLFSRSLQNG